MEEFKFFYYFLIFCTGACIGSFSIAAANRITNNEDYIYKPSHCDSCNTILRFYEKIPILSWILQKNKCNYCGSAIGVEVFWSELISGLLFVFIIFIYGFNLEGFYFLTLAGLLFAITLSDLKSKAIIDSWLLIFTIISLLPISHDFGLKLQNFLIFCGGFFLLDFFVTFYIQNIKSKITKNINLQSQKALGEADMLIAGAIGANLGIVLGLSSIFLASCLAIIPSILNNIYKKDSQLPFVPFLFIGFLIVLSIKELM